MWTRLYVQAMTALGGDEGATSAEYAIMASLIAVAIILAVTTLGVAVGVLFDNSATELARIG
jgi:Flp pilus assembly pilin Flp